MTAALPEHVIAWRCRRGMLELDVLLQRFYKKHYSQLQFSSKQAFARLLDYSDQDLLGILMDKTSPADKDLVDVVEKIKAYS
ncbi:MAG: succinate dehydrogenase assembly factor 2 [Gammaproteobacteria bacterium]|nr:succinate dehydrogenase assembly factor 2 [Gammaproteobacteria bacterium]